MSMITEQIKSLREAANIWYEFKVSDLLNKAADTIEQLAAKVRAANMERSTAYYNGGWIPVSERLPESGKEVLVWYEYWSDKRESMVQTFGISFYWNTWCGDVMGIKARCIAWMPLPEPYREDGSK